MSHVKASARALFNKLYAHKYTKQIAFLPAWGDPPQYYGTVMQRDDYPKTQKIVQRADAPNGDRLVLLYDVVNRFVLISPPEDSDGVVTATYISERGEAVNVTLEEIHLKFFRLLGEHAGCL